MSGSLAWLENIILSHEVIADRAVVAIAHENGERPYVAVPKRDPAEYSAAEKDALYAELLDILGQHLPKWQLPDGLVLLDQLPLTATGKISKIKRQKFEGYFQGGVKIMSLSEKPRSPARPRILCPDLTARRSANCVRRCHLCGD